MTDITDTNHPLFVEGSAQAVRNTMQLYVPTAVSARDEWPIDADDTYRGLALPSGCVLLWPEGDPPDLPFTVDPPDAGRIPWPISSMGAPPPEWARFDAETTRAISTAQTSSTGREKPPPDRPDAHPRRTDD